MSGLLLKDIIGLRGYWRIVVPLVVIFSVAGVGTGELALITPSMLLLCAMMPLSAVAIDDQAKWDAYCCCLPLPRRVTVGSKYLLCLLMIGGALVLTAVLGLLISLRRAPDWAGIVLSTGTMACIATVMISIMIPLLYRFGTEKARLIMMGVFMVGMLAFIQMDWLLDVLAGLEGVPLWLAPIAAAGVLVASYFISLSIYTKKEF